MIRMMSEMNNKRDVMIVMGFVVPFLFCVCLMFMYRHDHNLPGIVDYNSGKYKIAIQELTDYSKNHPCTNNQSLFNSKPQLARQYLGLAYLADHQYQRAEEAFKDPCIEKLDSHYYLGFALRGQGKLQEARVEFAKEVDIEEGAGKGQDLAKLRRAEEEIRKIDKLR